MMYLEERLLYVKKINHQIPALMLNTTIWRHLSATSMKSARLWSWLGPLQHGSSSRQVCSWTVLNKRFGQIAATVS